MPIYRDYSGVVKLDLPDLAEYRINNPAPLLNGCQCPAAEYTFAISTDEGKTWRNPTTLTKMSLREAVLNTNRCCLNLDNQCPIRK